MPGKEASGRKQFGGKRCQGLDWAHCRIRPCPTVQAEQFESKHVRRQLYLLIAFYSSAVARGELGSDRVIEHAHVVIRVQTLPVLHASEDMLILTSRSLQMGDALLPKYPDWSQCV